MPNSTHRASWALAYLRGRAAAYRRGRVSLKNVFGAVGVALRRHAGPDAVRGILAEYGLTWNIERGELVDDEGVATPADWSPGRS